MALALATLDNDKVSQDASAAGPAVGAGTQPIAESAVASARTRVVGGKGGNRLGRRVSVAPNEFDLQQMLTAAEFAGAITPR